ncbi:uncharacterized protein LOC144043506 [Vanacampus margaritifer]
MLKDSSARATFSQVATVLILVCLLEHTVDCYRLKKADRRKYVPEGFRRGKIVFGKVPQWDPPVLDEEAQKANSSVEDEDAYQADSAGGWGINPVPLQQPSTQESSWRRMTSLQCGDNHMKLSVKRPGLGHMMVQQAPNAPPLPLPLVPLNCGYTMHRNPFGFLMYVPYGGCYMLNQAENYALPMYWHGVPVILMCTKQTATDAPKVTSPPQSAPIATKGPDVRHIPMRPPVSPLNIWSPLEPHSQAQPPLLGPRTPSDPRTQSPHSVPPPKWPFVRKWPPMSQSPVSHPGLHKPPVPHDPLYNFEPQAPQNPFMSHYPVMPRMPYMQSLPRPYQVPHAMAQYPYFNPSLWPLPGHQPRAGKPDQSNPKPAAHSKFPHFPTSVPVEQPPATAAPATTAAPDTDTTPMPYNPLYPFPPELMHYITYEELLAAMYANQ